MQVINDEQSKSKSSAESGPLDIFMDMFGINRFFDNFAHAEGSIT